jgi:hypothetical protein
MLPLLLLAVVFFFLVVGAAAFVFCVLMPPLRKYSLSAALWCATWGPCSVAWIMLAGLVMVANDLAMQAAQARRFHLPNLPNNLGVGYAVLGLLGMLLVATPVAWIHQMLVRQMTFALFRIYAGLVSAGVGSIWGWCLYIWLVLNTHLPYRFSIWALGMMGLCAGFGYEGFRWARKLRGDTPTKPGLVSQEEFEGSA